MLINLLVNDLFIISLIVLNALVLFLDSFDAIQNQYPWLIRIDLVISLFFIAEMLIKIKRDSWRGYISDSWNRFDFVINLCIVPSFVLFFMNEPDVLFVTIIRLARIARFFRFFRFVPNIDHLMNGVARALKASVFIVFALSLYLFIVAIISCSLFKEVAPQHFGDPFAALYSTFKVFTIEGWYDLPEVIADKYGTLPAFGVKLYFIFLVLTGGVCGMSLVNAIFVDEMVADNNDFLLEKIDTLSGEIRRLSEQINSLK